MEYNLKDKDELARFKIISESYEAREIKVYLQPSHLKEEEAKKEKKRTTKQNSSIHKFFEIVSEALNEIGQEFCYTGLKGLDLSVRYTPNIVKDFFWRPIQIAMFNIESTTKLTTIQINNISDVIIKFFGDKGVVVEFPKEDRVKTN